MISPFGVRLEAQRGWRLTRKTLNPYWHANRNRREVNVRRFGNILFLGEIRMNRVATGVLSVLLVSFVGREAFSQVLPGHFVDVTPVLADVRFHDYSPSLTADGLTMLFAHVGYGELPARTEVGIETCSLQSGTTLKMRLTTLRRWGQPSTLPQPRILEVFRPTARRCTLVATSEGSAFTTFFRQRKTRTVIFRTS